jgi:hypothetical protein
MQLSAKGGVVGISEHDLPDHPVAVAVHGFDHSLVAGIFDSDEAQIVPMERFVDDPSIRPLGEGIHQGGRDVAWSRPEIQAQYGHRRDCMAKSWPDRAICARVSPLPAKELRPSPFPSRFR